MKKSKKMLCIMLVVMLLITMIPYQVEASSKLKLNKTKATIYVGETLTLKVKGAKNAKWTTSKKSVASVTSKGKVTAKKKGTTTITAKVGSQKLTCKITVKNPYLNKTQITLNTGEMTTLKLTGASVKSWKSSNEKVATISSKGKVTAQGKGTATITCKDKKGKKYTCEVTVTEKHTHKYASTVTKKATCTEEGILTYKCACGDTYTGSIAKTSHTFSDWIVDKKATCTENGSKHKECTICRTILQTESIVKTEHVYEDTIVTKPTCTENGYTIYKCNCGESFKDNIIPALGHKWSDWQVIKEPTESETGEKQHVCSICNQKETESIPVLEHVHEYSTTVTAPTCTEQGYTTYTCQCGDSYTSDYKDCLGHDIFDWIITKEATCTEDGWKVKKCNRCGFIEEEAIIFATGHKFDEGSITKEATCTESGEKTYICTNCGEVKIETIEAVGHVYGEFETITEPIDFETFGSAKMVCSRCETVLFDNLTSVLVDAGNGESSVMYGYYDYEEAKKCFELTYQYKEANDFFSKSGNFVYEWNDDMYNLSCIRCAEMAYLANQCETIADFKATNFHQRPSGGSGGYENMIGQYSLHAYLDVEYSAEDAFQSWMDSRGHRENIEDAVSNTSLAQFTAWIPSWNSWDIFWVQNF